MKNIAKILPDLLVCGGAVFIVVGVTMVSVPAAFIAAGVFLIAEGVLSAIGGDSACSDSLSGASPGRAAR